MIETKGVGFLAENGDDDKEFGYENERIKIAS
jgi:hypothetical protein